MDIPLHSDFITRFEGGGACGLGMAKNLHIGETDPVCGSVALPHTPDVQVVETIIVELVVEVCVYVWGKGGTLHVHIMYVHFCSCKHAGTFH